LEVFKNNKNVQDKFGPLTGAFVYDDKGRWNISFSFIWYSRTFLFTGQMNRFSLKLNCMVQYGDDAG